MEIKAVLFDIYGTLIDIETDEKDWYVYLNLAKYLGYRGVMLSADEVRWIFFEKIQKQLDASKEKYPEIDIKQIWREILTEHENPQLYRLNLRRYTFLEDLVVLHRALTRKRIRLYDTTYTTLKQLKSLYQLGIVSDAQWDFAIPELKIVQIIDFFEAIIISGEHGFRKPDQRLFNECLSKLNIQPKEAVFVGNDTFRDVSGAKAVGMKTILVMSQYGSKDTRLGDPDLQIETINQLPDKLKDL